MVRSCCILLCFAIFGSLCTISQALREVMPPKEYLKPTKACKPFSSTFYKSLIIPEQSSYRFECRSICTKDKSSIQLRTLWLFQSSDELKVAQISGTESHGNYTIDDDGTLEVLSIGFNGTWYCKHNGRVYVAYSVTVTNRNVKPTNLSVVQMNKHAKFKTVDLTLTTKPVLKTNCSVEFNTGFRRTIYQYHVSVSSNATSIDLPIAKMKLFGSLQLYDFDIPDELRNLFPGLPSDVVIYYYELCNAGSKVKGGKSETAKYTDQIKYAKQQTFRTRFENLGTKIVISCGFRGVKEYRWKMIEHDDKNPKNNQSQWLSPIFIGQNNHRSMHIDFLNNLCISKLDMNHYKYRYACYDINVPISSTKVKFSAGLSNLLGLSLLPSIDSIMLFCLICGTLMLIILIRGNGDVDSKL